MVSLTEYYKSMAEHKDQLKASADRGVAERGQRPEAKEHIVFFLVFFLNVSLYVACNVCPQLIFLTVLLFYLCPT